MDLNVRLRNITPKDMGFLYSLYASTRAEELAPLDWPDEQKVAFLQMQFNAQHSYYMDQFCGADFQIIMLNSKPVGRLYIDRREDEIRVIDIALLPEHRNKGIGSHYLNAILAESERMGLPVRLHVESNNPAIRLYEQLGFEKISDTGLYYFMERKVADSVKAVRR